MYTNAPEHGGNFLNVIDDQFNTSSGVIIASGYTSYDILTRYNDRFIRIAREGGTAKLLLGMAFYEGLSVNNINFLRQLSTSLQELNDSSGVFVTYSGRYHGKIFKFFHEEQSVIYLGSSNFSRSGLSGNIEATTKINDLTTLSEITAFLDFLFLPNNAVSILNAEIAIPGTDSYRDRISLRTMDDLQRYNPLTIDKMQYPVFEFPLSRIVEHEKSNLNVYFGKGRLNTRTGVVSPRPWYEIELIASAEIRRNPLYPHGNFTCYTDDGFIIPMKTSGDYLKNIRSRTNLSILGQWIKGKLQRANALLPLTPVTQDVLDFYGNSILRFYKMDNDRYFIEF